MTEILSFILGVLVADVVTRYKVNKLLNQLNKVSHTGEDSFRYGVMYSMDQIRKVM